jgi:hypothetical protein
LTIQAEGDPTNAKKLLFPTNPFSYRPLIKEKKEVLAFVTSLKKDIVEK